VALRLAALATDLPKQYPAYAATVAIYTGRRRLRPQRWPPARHQRRCRPCAARPTSGTISYLAGPGSYSRVAVAAGAHLPADPAIVSPRSPDRANMPEELLDLVDQDDRVIGTARKRELSATRR